MILNYLKKKAENGLKRFNSICMTDMHKVKCSGARFKKQKDFRTFCIGFK